MTGFLEAVRGGLDRSTLVNTVPGNRSMAGKDRSRACENPRFSKSSGLPPLTDVGGTVSALMSEIRFMGVHLFNPFSKMIDRVPAGAIVAVVKREAQMLAEDLAKGRMSLGGEVHSILSFCRFVEASQSGLEVPPVTLPMTDTAFYRKTTERLVSAGELPSAAREQFDAVFSRATLKLLSSVP